MDAASIGSDGTDELLTSLDPLLDQSTQLVLESSREEKSFASTLGSSRQETVFICDSKSSEGRNSKLHGTDSPRFDPRHASVAEILERTDRQLKALSETRKSNVSSSTLSAQTPPEPKIDHSRKSTFSAFSMNTNGFSENAPDVKQLQHRRDHRFSDILPDTKSGQHWDEHKSENWRSARPEEIVISRPVFTRSNGLGIGFDWNTQVGDNSALFSAGSSNFVKKRSHPDNPMEDSFRQRLYEAQEKVASYENEIEGLRENCSRKDTLLQQLDKNFADVVLKNKQREGEKDQTIVDLRDELKTYEAQVSRARCEQTRLQNLLVDAERRVKEKDDATAAFMAESKDKMWRGAEEVSRLRDELEIESRRKNDLLRRNQTMHEENIKIANSLKAAEKSLEENRLTSSYKEKDCQAAIDKKTSEIGHLNDVIRKQDAVITDLQQALRMAQAELERWKVRESEWEDERKSLISQSQTRQAELQIGVKRWEKEVRAKHEKELAEQIAAAEVSKSQAEQRLRESHRNEIHALTARHHKELAQVRDRADQEVSRRLAVSEETAQDLRSEVNTLRERCEHLRQKSCDSEAQRLRALGQMQALMQASCSQALNVLTKPTDPSEPSDIPQSPPAVREPFSSPVGTVLRTVEEHPRLEPGENFDIIDSLVARDLLAPRSPQLENGLTAGSASRDGSRPPSSADLINFASSRLSDSA